MLGYIVAGKNNGGYKYGGIAEKPPKVCLMLITLVRLIITGYIVAGQRVKIMAGINMAELPKKTAKFNPP